MSEESKPFTVTDRRKFTPDGRLRGDESEPAAEERGAPDQPSTQRAPRDADPAAALPPEAPPDFAGFLLSLAAQASAFLSSPEGNAVENLAGARHMISLLEMLADKTEGRRTAEEERLLEGMLYELRMAYLERSKTVSA